MPVAGRRLFNRKKRKGFSFTLPTPLHTFALNSSFASVLHPEWKFHAEGNVPARIEVPDFFNS